MANHHKVANRITHAVKKMNLISFPFHPNDLNLSANNGSSATNRKENIKVDRTKKTGFKIRSLTLPAQPD